MLRRLRLAFARFKLRLVTDEIDATNQQLRDGSLESASEIPLLNAYVKQLRAERTVLRSRIQFLTQP